jgi:hypothetical protein
VGEPRRSLSSRRRGRASVLRLPASVLAAGGEQEESEHPADLRKYDDGHGHTGSSTNFFALTKQTWVVAVMKRFSLESSTNQSGIALQPVDVVRSACSAPRPRYRRSSTPRG